VPIFRAWVDPSTGYEGGRLGGSPTSLSVFAGIVLVLSLTLGSLGSGILPRIFIVIAPIVMILGGGKAGIIGGVLSATLIYLLKRKVGSAFVTLIAMLGLGFVLVLISSPLNAYFHTYLDSENGENLTGRTSIWETAVPVILQKPVLGHGYMGSRFVSVEIGSKGHDLWEADHMHNAFLDVLYNNGVVGLILIMIVHVITIKNLLRVITCRCAPRQLNEIAVAFLAIYANLLINAFCNAIIGGRPSALFLIFLALFALSGCFQRVLRRTSFSPGTAKQELTSRKPQMAPAFGQL
jgi:O-antigen ligase